MNPRQRFALSVGSLLACMWAISSRGWATDVDVTAAGAETHTNHVPVLAPTAALILATALLVRLLRGSSDVEGGAP